MKCTQLSDSCSSGVLFLSFPALMCGILWFMYFFFLSAIDDQNELIVWSEGVDDSWRRVSDGPEVRSVRTDGHRGGARAAGGAEGHEATQEGGGAPQVGSDDLWCSVHFTHVVLYIFIEWLIPLWLLTLLTQDTERLYLLVTTALLLKFNRNAPNASVFSWNIVEDGVQE